MEHKKRLPVGMEDFADIRREDFYYVDKSGLIEELIENRGAVNLFTRPRRFGKSLNMNMLRHFFEPGCDRTLFTGLKVWENEPLCRAYMGKYPVISMSLKGVQGETYETARGMLAMTVNEEAYRVVKNMELHRLPQYQQTRVGRLLDHEMSEEELMNSIRILSSVLRDYYGQKVIILLDEYDVPLDKAFENRYYDSMVSLLKNMFAQALKTNENLYFAVVTGCLRIAKESIFTGFNNFKVFSVTDVLYDEYFGFTDEEVRALLEYYGLESQWDKLRQWYDGYRFGNVDVYCPWDVICCCQDMRVKPETEPKGYWINTSENRIVRRLVKKADRKTKREIEQLIAGETVLKEMRQELTYQEIGNSIDNLWSVLFTTGYLTMKGEPSGKQLSLVIPNMEVRDIFVTQIQQWFQELAYEDKPRLESLCRAFRQGDAKAVEEQFTAYLKKTISIRDIATKSKKENFYHGILLGLLNYDSEWVVMSNAESGDGYSDILVEIEDEDMGIVIEIKYAEDGVLETGCRQALEQIEKKQYDEKLRLKGMTRSSLSGSPAFENGVWQSVRNDRGIFMTEIPSILEGAPYR